MTYSNDNLDRLVQLITERVVEQLSHTDWGAALGASKSCGSTGSDCGGCGHCAVKKPLAVQKILAAGADRIGSRVGIDGHKMQRELASRIDHTLLKPDATREELLKVCREAKEFGFATVCVNSANIPLVARQLRGSSVLPIAVVGFPLGAASSQAKAFEAGEAIRAGAREIDMVVNIGALKSRDYKLVLDDIAAVVKASRPHKVKVIIETGRLDDEEKIVACTLAKAAGAAFVKTSTGFGGGGATVEDIALMRRIVGSDMEVKASGGIRTQEDAQKMIQAGADRIGASAGIAIVTGKSGGKKGNY